MINTGQHQTARMIGQQACFVAARRTPQSVMREPVKHCSVERKADQTSVAYLFPPRPEARQTKRGISSCIVHISNPAGQ